MKKMIFTALSVVAFSGAAMAKTAEVKEDVVFSNENKVEAAVGQGPGDNEGTATPCQESAILLYESIINGGEDKPLLLNALMGLCML
jgi:hypothetical protein